MALPVVLFHASSGSDTQASGAGPGTAIFGTGASINGTTSIDLSADTPDLSGVATDGSAVLWVNTTSGRKFFKITNTNNTTKIVTVANAATGTESGRTWAIGGKRATLDAATSRVLLTADILPGWTCRIENAGGTQLMTTSTITLGVSGDVTSGKIIIEGDSTSSHAVLSQSANVPIITSGARSYYVIRNLKFQNTNGTKTSARGVDFSGSFNDWEISNCIFGDSTNTLRMGIERTAGTQFPVYIRDCAVEFCTAGGLYALGGVFWTIEDCTVNDNGGIGIDCSIDQLFVNRCIVENNTGDGIQASRSTARVLIQGCTIDGNGGDGIDTSGNLQAVLHLYNNNITNNANYGIRCASGQGTWQQADCNNFYNNTSGARLNFDAGTNDQAVDPSYANRAGRDFSVGAAVKALGFPIASRYVGANRSATLSYVDIGAAQRQEAASGGGSAYIIGG